MYAAFVDLILKKAW